MEADPPRTAGRPEPPGRRSIGSTLAAVRVVLVLTLITGLAYPLAMTAAAQIPGLHGKADGCRITGADGRPAAR